MMGGLTFYADDLIFALADDGRLYFKVGDINQPDYEAAGMTAFSPFEDGKTMAYWEVPAKVYEDDAELPIWIDKAVEVSRRSKKKKKK